MPFIKIEAINPTKEQKEQLIVGFTKVASETLGIDPKFFYVLVKENSTDNWGMGGQTLTEFFKENAK